MERVTTEFSKYPLYEINQELREIPGMEDVRLPEYVGGSRVHLLIGINDPELEPVRLFNLPSGLGVYRSALTDIFGSNICYGGPHRVFSRININQGPMVNTIMFANEVAMFRDSVYGNSGIGLRTGEEAEQNQTKEIRCSIPIIGSRIQVNPTPLTRRDFDIGGCDLDSESEDEWDGEISSLGTCSCITASVDKATIPIARLREVHKPRENQHNSSKTVLITDIQNTERSGENLDEHYYGFYQYCMIILFIILAHRLYIY